LIRYFGFVGTGLVLLLIGLGWCFPQPTAESPGSVSNGPTIRIASAERLPERVVNRASLRSFTFQQLNNPQAIAVT
jgi:hypothetical protein